MASKKARFFCEFCGAEVKRDDKLCKTCGRFFASVRCPKCGTTGGPGDFKRGCPNCGYAFGKDSGRNAVIKTKKGGEPDSLPFWIYAAVFLLTLVVAFFVVLSVKT